MSNSDAVALGKLGGLKGGAARAAKLSPEERSAIASHAARKRWGSKLPYSPPQSPQAWLDKAKGALELIEYHNAVCREYPLEQWFRDLIAVYEKY